MLAQCIDFFTETRNIANSSTGLSCQPRSTNILRVVTDILREIFEVGFVGNLLVEFLRQVQTHVASHFLVHDIGKVLEPCDELLVLHLELGKLFLLLESRLLSRNLVSDFLTLRH